jgi:hypothetical protein
MAKPSATQLKGLKQTSGLVISALVLIPVLVAVAGLPFYRSTQKTRIQQSIKAEKLKRDYEVYTNACQPEPASGCSQRMRELAENGNAYAQYYVAQEILNRPGAVEDPVPAEVEAIPWLEKAANQGEVACMLQLGLAYRAPDNNGRYVHDSEKAFHWLREAAEAGDASAMNYLAESYAMGDITTKSYASAALWFERSAEAGFVSSFTALGDLHREGKAPNARSSEAYKWYTIACAKFSFMGPIWSKEICSIRDDIERQLSHSEVARVQARASEWMKAHPGFHLWGQN